MRTLPEYNQCQLELRVSTPFILLMQFVRQKLRSAFLAGTSVNLNLVNCSKTRSLLTRSKKHDFYVGTPMKNFAPPSPSVRARNSISFAFLAGNLMNLKLVAYSELCMAQIIFRKGPHAFFEKF